MKDQSEVNMKKKRGADLLKIISRQATFLLIIYTSSVFGERDLPDPNSNYFYLPFDACPDEDFPCIKYTAVVDQLVLGGSEDNYLFGLNLREGTSLVANFLQIKRFEDYIFTSYIYGDSRIDNIITTGNIEILGGTNTWNSGVITGNIMGIRNNANVNAGELIFEQNYLELTDYANLDATEIKLHSSGISLYDNVKFSTDRLIYLKTDVGREHIYLTGNAKLLAKEVGVTDTREKNEFVNTFLTLTENSSLSTEKFLLSYGQMSLWGNSNFKSTESDFKSESSLTLRGSSSFITEHFSMTDGDFTIRDNSKFEASEAIFNSSRLYMFDNSSILFRDKLDLVDSFLLIREGAVNFGNVFLTNSGVASDSNLTFENLVIDAGFSRLYGSESLIDIKNLQVNIGSIEISLTKSKLNAPIIETRHDSGTIALSLTESEIHTGSIETKSKLDIRLGMNAFVSVLGPLTSEGEISISSYSFDQDSTLLNHLHIGTSPYRKSEGKIDSLISVNRAQYDNSKASLSGVLKVLQIDSVGHLLKVSAGTAVLNDGSEIFLITENTHDFNASVYKDLPKITGGGVPGILSVGNTNIELSTNNPSPGDFISLFSSHVIGLGARNSNDLRHSFEIVSDDGVQFQSITTSRLGNIKFSSFTEQRIAYFPEKIRAGCGELASVLTACAIDVFGARAARVLDESQADQFSFSYSATLAEASEFLKNARTLELARDSSRAYTARGGHINASQSNLISSLELEGLLAFAEINDYGAESGDITIAIRGTNPKIDASLLYNLIVDSAFLAPQNDFMAEYINNAASFIGTVKRANPDSTIRLTGHSLGGGLANFLGYVSGLESISYNAPDISNLINYYNNGYFVNELGEIINIVQRQPGDYSHIQSVRNVGDLISGVDLGNYPSYGQKVSISSLNSDLLTYISFLQNPESNTDVALDSILPLSVWRAINKAHNIHGLASVIDNLEQIDATKISSIFHNDLEIYARSGKSFFEILEQVKQQIIVPVVSGPGPVKNLLHSVIPGLIFLIDPTPSNEFEFFFESDSVRLNRLIAPNIVGTSDDYYLIMVEANGEWSELGQFFGGEIIDLPQFYSRIKVKSPVDLGLYFSSDELFFAGTFAEEGVYSGTISVSAVPEISRAHLLIVGMLVVWGSKNLRNRNLH